MLSAFLGSAVVTMERAWLRQQRWAGGRQVPSRVCVAGFVVDWHYNLSVAAGYFIKLGMFRSSAVVYDHIDQQRVLESLSGITYYSHPCLGSMMTYFRLYASPIPFCTADLSAILSIHFNRCGKSISSLVKPVFSQPFTQHQVLMSATLYLPLPLPARYSLGSPVYLPDRRISRTP
jgi:hypothetical protein